jgi:hypothetical protein
MVVSTVVPFAVFVRGSKSISILVSFLAIDSLNAEQTLKKISGMRNLVSVLTAPTCILTTR